MRRPRNQPSRSSVHCTSWSAASAAPRASASPRSSLRLVAGTTAEPLALAHARDGPDPLEVAARVPLGAPALVRRVVGEVLVGAVGIAAHAVEGQRLDLLCLHGVGVAVLGPAVEVDEVV